MSHVRSGLPTGVRWPGRPTVRVRVPATSANLGPGFDALGLALSLYDDVVVRVCDAGLPVDIAGEGADTARDRRGPPGRARPAGRVRPCSAASRAASRWCARTGSRTAAASAPRPPRSWPGILAARALVLGGAAALDDGALLGLATEIEGHPDNVAACLLGGLTLAWTDGRRGPGGPARARWPRQAGGLRTGPAPVRTEMASAAAAATGAARGRGGQRRARRPAGRRADALPASRACCSPPPRTGCTRSTGRRRCRKRPRWATAAGRRHAGRGLRGRAVGAGPAGCVRGV